MDPTKLAGKLKEQVEIEDITRRKFGRKHGYTVDKEANNVYNQNYVNNEIAKLENDSKDLSEYTGEGESYFISKEMYESLMGTCRCGRRKTDGHLLKCLQKCQSNRFVNYNLYDDSQFKDEKTIQRKIPETSSGFYGWPNAKYEKWEKATKYVSPKYTMVGSKIVDHPYSNIFIG